MRYCFLALIASCALLLWQRPAPAGYVHFCAPEELIAKSDVLAVGEVIKVTTVASELKSPPLLRRQATIRVLRAWSSSATIPVTAGQTIELEYETKDWAHLAYYTGGFDYPDFSAGLVELLPLKAPATGSTLWRLASYEEGSTIPATAASWPDVHAANGSEFIATEIAGALVNGTPAERNATAWYLSQATHGRDNGGNAAPLDKIDRLLTAQVPDEARWLDIFLTLYAPRGMWETPHPTIKALLTAPTKQGLGWFLVGRALSHLNAQNLDERIITALIAQGDAGAFSSAATLKLNYAHDPYAMRQLQAALTQAAPGALRTAQYLLSSSSPLAAHSPLSHEAKDATVQPFKPLLPLALATARRILAQSQVPTQELKTACEFLAEFGAKDDIKALLNEIKSARKVNQARYEVLVLTGLYGQTNTLPIWRVVINDVTVADVKYWGSNWRYCDFAALELQRLAKTDFGLKEPTSQLTLVQRNHAVAKAKAWLALHPQS